MEAPNDSEIKIFQGEVVEQQKFLFFSWQTAQTFLTRHLSIPLVHTLNFYFFNVLLYEDP